jgi:hypothetical protein
MARQPVSDASDRNTPEAVRLRAAHQLLDERPAPRVRAAVLRAAAQVRERPAPSPAPVSRERSARPWLRWRPAAAAAATATVAALAIGVAINVDRETSVGNRIETPAPAPPAAAAPADTLRNTPAPEEATVEQAKRAAPAAPVAARQSAPAMKKERVGQAQSVTATAPTSRAATSAGSLPPAEGRTTDQLTGASARERTLDAAAPAPAAAPPPAGAIGPAPAPTAGQPATADVRQNAFARAKAQRDAEPRSRDDWLARIIELRRAGQDVEADGELARFRAAFPDATIPAAALNAGLDSNLRQNR